MKTTSKKTATSQRPSPPSKRCMCKLNRGDVIMAHRRTCPDYTEEDVAWCAKQWDYAARAIREAVYAAMDAIPVGAAPVEVLAMGAKLGVVVQIPREKLHGQDPVEVAQFMAALVANGWTPEVR